MKKERKIKNARCDLNTDIGPLATELNIEIRKGKKSAIIFLVHRSQAANKRYELGSKALMGKSINNYD